jgi:hypothetical protein
MGRPFKCPYCGHSESVSKGVRRTKSMGSRQIRLCKSCRRKFTPKNQKLAEATAPSIQPAPVAAPATPVTEVLGGSGQAQPQTTSVNEVDAKPCPTPNQD